MLGVSELVSTGVHHFLIPSSSPYKLNSPLRMRKKRSSSHVPAGILAMVAAFRGSVTVPGSPNPSEENKPRHARSTSLPSLSHPAVSHLHDQICALRSWPLQPDGRHSPPPAGEWIVAGFTGIGRLHDALHDLLRLPLVRDPLRPAPWADRLLDAFLRLADAHGSFRSVALALRQHLSEARVATRRHDPGRLSSALRAHRRAEKALARLASAAKDIARHAPLAPGLPADEAEIADILREAVEATATTSAAVFAGVAAVSSAAETAAALALKGSSTVGTLMRLSSTTKKAALESERETAALERLEEAQECIEGLEKGSERVLRSLMNNRVSLLNILSPSL
ncbi:hypothetical protein OPV22_009451 [Ensete ventricosum]|uniref:Uncharacterized protein n=1 Tax=Ensete ventricosum TaxID=4639 RepID=A0AAV8RH01_ENSVE|nr:hypothetical protein OPV22_009451 [Ensete ventricosum]